MNWEKYLGFELSVTLWENFGVIVNDKLDKPFYEVSFKVGYLTEIYDDGIIISSVFQDRQLDSFIPFNSIKCVDILAPEKQKN